MWMIGVTYMKQSPELRVIQENMLTGSLAAFGFLGSDTRSLADILRDDDERVTSLALTHEAIAERLQFFYDKGQQSLGQTVATDHFDVVVEEHKGGIPCPFRDNFTAPKAVITVTERNSGQTMTWSALNIHMIRAHGFYEGVGAKFRVEPETVAELLWKENL